MKINLISAYEELMKIDPEQRVTERDGDYRTYKQSATNEQIESVYEKALSAIGMTEEEMIANATQFPYWQDIFNRMSSHLSNVPDPTIGVEEMNRYGYTWDGMYPLRQKTAKELLAKGVEIYRLYSYNQDERVNDLIDILSHAKRGGIFGIEKAVWDDYRQKKQLNDDVDYAKLPDQPKKTAKDKLEEITAKLEQGIADVCTSENYQAYLKTMAKFHKYSYNNSLLIWMQKPEATMVAGYNAWKSKFERQVMKGEHGITIIAPCPSQKTEEILKLDPKTLQPILDSNGVPVKEKTTISSMRFKATTVFDVSQTEGKPLPAPPIKDLSGNVENYATMLQALIQAAPCPVSFGDPGSGAKGSFDRGTQSITIKEGMSQQETLATLVHEIGHSHLHADPEEAKKLERGTREVQAESVAYTVCSHYGIDTSEWTFGYVATWSKGKEIKTLQSVLDTIRSTSAKIIDQTDEQLDLIQSQRLQPQQQQNDLSLTMNMS